MAIESMMTAIGLAKLKNAQLLDQKLNITHYAVGTGDDNKKYQPTEQQTALKGEVHKATIDEIKGSETDPTVIEITSIVPSNVGGWTMRELGLFDDAGDLVVISTLPEMYKVQAAEGATLDAQLTVLLKNSNADEVEVILDPAVIMASRQYVNSKLAADLAAQKLGDHNDVNLTALAVHDALRWDGANWINVPGGKEVAALRKKALLNTLLNSMQDATSISVLNAFADGFADDSNIDATKSSAWSYDAGRDLIKSTQNWAGNQTSMTAGKFGDHVQWDSDGVFMSATFTGHFNNTFWDPDTSFAGPFEFAFTYVNSNGDGAPTGLYFSLVPDDIVATLTDTTFHFGKFALPIGGGGGQVAINENNTATANNVTINPGDRVIMRRLADNRFQVLVNDVIQYTSTFTYAGNLRPAITINHNSLASSPRHFRVNNIAVTQPGDMTLVSKASEADQEPADGFMLAIIEGDPILGTDLLAALSKNDGTTWDAVTLEAIGETEDGHTVVFGETDFSVSGDQTIRWRLQTQNQKPVSVHGVVMDAEQ